MFLLKEPTPADIERLLAARRDAPFSYDEPGLTRDSAPAGYKVDHNRVVLGAGRDVFESSRRAIADWAMFDIDWLRLCPSRAEVAPGTLVAVLIHHVGFWSLNPARIVYVIDGDDHRFGFAYGTVADHAERGEERFVVEWGRDDESVSYDILAFSRPNHLLSVFGYPVTRRLQKRFARDSIRAMCRAVSGRTRSAVQR
jgi:uncharacterized protein (UPF0548 family)